MANRGNVFFSFGRYPKGRTTASLSGVRFASVLRDKFFSKIPLHATNALIFNMVNYSFGLFVVNLALPLNSRGEHSGAVHQVYRPIFLTSRFTYQKSTNFQFLNQPFLCKQS
ncbi:hypothetical protein AAKU52_002615 [Pedobacter sp. CG_S7]